MIVPRNKLLAWFAAIVLPFALLAAVEPGSWPIAFGCIALFLLAALADAWRARSALAGISVHPEPIVRVSRDRPATLKLRLRNEHQAKQILRFTLDIPPGIESPAEDLRVALPDSEWAACEWPCVARRRGNFPVRTARLQAASPFGFWDFRVNQPVQSEIRVYPNLLSERRQLAALFLNRGAFGAHAQRQVGRGREFEKLREYMPGDSFDEIHWKATARRSRPVTKVFQIERTQEVYVIIDASRLSGRSAGKKPGEEPSPETALERFVTAALVLGLAAERQGDLFGLLTFSDRVHKFIRAKNGKAHYGVCRDALYTLQPRVVTPDFEELCAFIRLRLRRRSLLFFLTALDDPVLKDSFVRNIGLLSGQHLVMVNMLQPPGVQPVFSQPDVDCLDDLYQHLGSHFLWSGLQELQKVLKHRGVRFSLLENESLSTELVSQYVGVKRRQLL